MKKKILLIFLCGMFIVGLTGCGADDINDNNDNEQQEEKLDGMEGTWYRYDLKTGVADKVSDTYIEPNGKGLYKGVTSGYVFHTVEAGDYYKINGKNVVFYYADGSEWRNCDITSEGRMTCSTNSTIEYYRR